MSRAACYVTLSACLLAACDDVALRAFEPRAAALGGTGDVGPSGEAGGGRAGTTTMEPTAGTAGTSAVSPLLIDDFEDGDPRAKEPLGWWYPINDKTAKQQSFGVEPISGSGGSGGTASSYALRTHGSDYRDWGSAVGVNLTADGQPLNALSYDRLCYVAQTENGATTSMQVHFLRDQELHYVQEVSLSDSWTRYCLRFSDFRQPDGTELVPTGIIALQFFFAPVAPFALWLDDVELEP